MDVSVENPVLFDALFLKRHLGTLTQYLWTHFRRSAFLFQFLCRDRAPIEMRLRMLPKESGHEARTRHRHGPDRDAAGNKKWGAEFHMGMLNGSKSVLPYSRLEDLAGSMSIMSVAIW